MLGTKAERAAYEVDLFGKQVLSLSSRIKDPKGHVAKTINGTP
jgi:hypothetical protein